MLSWFDIIEPRRAVASVPHKVSSEREVAFAVWRDMAEEPEKYGEDIAEWLTLDAQLRAGPGHWRVHAYWLSKEAELEAKELEAQEPWRALFSRIAAEAAVKGQREWFRRDMRRILKAHRKTERKQTKAAIKIQAAWRGFLGRKRAAKKAKKAAKKAKKAATLIQAAVRGHQTRSQQDFRDCCLCLTHRICPLKTDVGMMCRECGEQGPHDDILGLEDPWAWFRADYRDLTKPEPEDDSYPLLSSRKNVVVVMGELGDLVLVTRPEFDDYVPLPPNRECGVCHRTKYPIHDWIDNKPVCDRCC